MGAHRERWRHDQLRHTVEDQRRTEEHFGIVECDRSRRGAGDRGAKRIRAVAHADGGKRLAGQRRSTGQGVHVDRVVGVDVRERVADILPTALSDSLLTAYEFGAPLDPNRIVRPLSGPGVIVAAPCKSCSASSFGLSKLLLTGGGLLSRL